MTARNIRVLLVEDNEFDAMVFQKVLENHNDVNFEVTHVDTLQEAQMRSFTCVFDVILLDLSLPDSFGIETFQKMTLFNLDRPIVVLSGNEDEELTLRSIKDGAQDFFIKGAIDKALLPQYILFAIERNAHLQESANPHLIDELTGLYNERGFTFLAQQQLKLAARTGLNFHFFYIELLNLDSITDTFCYDGVHLALTQSAALLKNTFDPLDILARTKIDRFSVLALDIEGNSEEELTQQFHHELDKINQSEQSKVHLEFKLGLVEYDSAQFSLFDSLFKKTESKLKDPEMNI